MASTLVGLLIRVLPQTIPCRETCQRPSQQCLRQPIPSSSSLSKKQQTGDWNASSCISSRLRPDIMGSNVTEACVTVFILCQNQMWTTPRRAFRPAVFYSKSTPGVSEKGKPYVLGLKQSMGVGVFFDSKKGCRAPPRSRRHDDSPPTAAVQDTVSVVAVAHTLLCAPTGSSTYDRRRHGNGNGWSSRRRADRAFVLVLSVFSSMGELDVGLSYPVQVRAFKREWHRVFHLSMIYSMACSPADDLAMYWRRVSSVATFPCTQIVRVFIA